MYVKSSSNFPTKFLLFTRENIWLIVLEQKCIIHEKIKIHRSTWIRNKLIIYNFYFYYTQSSYSPIISYHRIYFPIISQTQFLLSHKKKAPIPLFPYTHDTRKKLPSNPSLQPSTIRTFLSRCAIRLQSNKSINKTPYLARFVSRYHYASPLPPLPPNSSHSSRRMEHTPWQKVSVGQGVECRHSSPCSRATVGQPWMP